MYLDSYFVPPCLPAMRQVERLCAWWQKCYKGWTSSTPACQVTAIHTTNYCRGHLYPTRLQYKKVLRYHVDMYGASVSIKFAVVLIVSVCMSSIIQQMYRVTERNRRPSNDCNPRINLCERDRQSELWSDRTLSLETRIDMMRQKGITWSIRMWIGNYRSHAVRLGLSDWDPGWIVTKTIFPKRKRFEIGSHNKSHKTKQTPIEWGWWNRQ